MTAASNSEAITSAMRALPSRIRSEANIADRPGQLGRLELIATEVEALLVAVSNSESAALATNSPNRGDDTSETAIGPENATQRPAPVDSGAIDWSGGIVAQTVAGEVVLRMTEEQAAQLRDGLNWLTGDDEMTGYDDE